MVETAVARQSPMLLTLRENQVQTMTVQGRGQGGHTGRGIYQGRSNQVRRFNLPSHTLLVRNFKGGFEHCGAVLGTTDNQREAKDQ